MEREFSFRVCVHCLAEEAERAEEERLIREELAAMDESVKDRVFTQLYAHNVTLQLEVQVRLANCNRADR